MYKEATVHFGGVNPMDTGILAQPEHGNSPHFFTDIKRGILEAVSFYALGGKPVLDIDVFIEHEEQRLLREEAILQRTEENRGQIVRSIEGEGYVKDAPAFLSLADDQDRTNYITYQGVRAVKRDDFESVRSETTEREGLKGLARFLGIVASHEDASERTKVAKSMLETLTYIGEKEFIEATAGIAQYWLSYLDEDPERQLCAVAKLGELGTIKSDGFVLESILEYIGEDRLAQYKGRLVTNPALLTSEPDKSKIVVLDDWIISGSSILTSCNRVEHELDLLNKNNYLSCLEINVITASLKKISSGISLGGVTVPVKAYFKAHDAEKSSTHGVHISGSHSSVDYEFEETIGEIFRGEQHRKGNTLKFSAPLINIESPYRDMRLRIVESLSHPNITQERQMI